MAQNASDIIVTGARVFLAPITATPVTLPLASVAVGAAWPTGWVDVGFTLEPTKLTYKFDMLEIFVEQSFSPVRRRRTKEEVTVETVLAEHTTGNLATAMAGLSTTTAAATGVPGYESFSVGGDPNLPTMMVGIEGAYNDEENNFFPVRMFLYQATVSDGGTLEFGKDKPAGIPLKLLALPDLTKAKNLQLLLIQRVTAVAI
ncbi:MAG: hypothetical protein WCG26_12080 [Chloroflexales bacterium]